MNEDNYYMRRHGCTRNQYRRIINGVAYKESLDGDKDQYNERKARILLNSRGS